MIDRQFGYSNVENTDRQRICQGMFKSHSYGRHGRNDLTQCIRCGHEKRQFLTDMEKLTRIIEKRIRAIERIENNDDVDYRSVSLEKKTLEWVLEQASAL